MDIETAQPLKLVQESDGNVAQGVHDVLGRGSQAPGKAVLVVVSTDTVISLHSKGEQIEPALQGDMTIQLIGQDGDDIQTVSR